MTGSGRTDRALHWRHPERWIHAATDAVPDVPALRRHGSIPPPRAQSAWRRWLLLVPRVCWDLDGKVGRDERHRREIVSTTTYSPKTKATLGLLPDWAFVCLGRALREDRSRVNTARALLTHVAQTSVSGRGGASRPRWTGTSLAQPLARMPGPAFLDVQAAGVVAW